MNALMTVALLHSVHHGHGGGGRGLVHLIASAAIWSVVSRFVRRLDISGGVWVLIVVGLLACAAYLLVSRRGVRARSRSRTSNT